MKLNLAIGSVLYGVKGYPTYRTRCTLYLLQSKTEYHQLKFEGLVVLLRVIKSNGSLV